MIAFTFPVPAMVVLTPAAIAFPVTVIESLAVVTGTNPMSTAIWWPRPISVMPLVMVPDGVPVAIYPKELRTRGDRPNPNRSGGRRRADSNSDRNLAEDYSACQ